MTIDDNIRELLGRLATAQERTAAVLERILIDVYRVDATAEAQLSALDEKELERDDNLTEEQTEWLALIETMEEAGISVPPSAYKKIGLEPPIREEEPTEAELDAPQPSPPAPPAPTARSDDDDGIVTARRED